ncbi:MAG: YchJ family protein [Betaproteobacteria bacterium]|nr:YchJ family protein [Betaproteobacteria bacterium]
MKSDVATPCYCGARQTYAECCGRIHAGEAAPTAEALMRSRYSAYVLALEPYLLATWHPGTRPPQLDLVADDHTKWLGLEIKRHQASGADSAVVEFIARFKTGGRAQRMHELSRFVRAEGRWFYVDGEFPEKSGRR